MPGTSPGGRRTTARRRRRRDRPAALEDSAGTAALAYLALIKAQALVAVRTELIFALANDLLALARAQVAAGAAEGLAAKARAEVRAQRRSPVAAHRRRRRGAPDHHRAGACARPRIRASPSLRPTSSMSRSAPARLPTPRRRRLSRRSSAAPSCASRPRPWPRLHRRDARRARRARLPKLEGFADAGRIGTAVDDTVTTWEIGVALSVPLFDRSADDEAAARHRAAQEQRRRGRSLPRHRRPGARVAGRSRDRSRGAGLGARTAPAVRAGGGGSARARFAAGVAGNLDVITAQVGLARANELVVVAQRRPWSWRGVQLAKAVGAATTLRLMQSRRLPLAIAVVATIPPASKARWRVPLALFAQGRADTPRLSHA